LLAQIQRKHDQNFLGDNVSLRHSCFRTFPRRLQK